jgi:hypothetical protein
MWGYENPTFGTRSSLKLECEGSIPAQWLLEMAGKANVSASPHNTRRKGKLGRQDILHPSVGGVRDGRLCSLGTRKPQWCLDANRAELTLPV